MNVSIKPFLILTSSPQMASLIYPFPRILAVHLKYAAANTSWKQPLNCQGHMGLLAFMPRTSLRTHSSHHLPTAMARYDYNYTTGPPRKKPDHAVASFGSTSFCVFFFCVFFFFSSQFLVTARACNKSRNRCCSTLVPLQGRLLIFSLIFKGLSLLLEKASDKLARWWHAPRYAGETEICFPRSDL